jgi:PAS domain S-box-containing protein
MEYMDDIEITKLRNITEYLEKVEFDLLVSRVDNIIGHFARISMDAVLTVTKDGTILTANLLAEKVLGYTYTELRKKNFEMLIPEPLRAVLMQNFLQFVQNPKVRYLGAIPDVSGRRKDGTIIPMNVAISAFNTEGVLVFLLLCSPLQ